MWPGSHWSAGQNRDESGVSTSSASTRLVAVDPELDLGVGDEDAALGRDLVATSQDPRREVAGALGRALAHGRHDVGIRHRLVVLAHAAPWCDGVKTGSGSREPSTSPSGSRTPLTWPSARYSRRPPPVR